MQVKLGLNRSQYLPSQLPQSWNRRLWQFLVVFCLILGLLFRFVNLDGKVYEYDETYTSLRISGYTEAEAVQSLSNRGTIAVKELLDQYQSPQPGKSPLDTMRGLALEEAQLTPLYFVAARFWTEAFGSSATAIRSLSVVVSLLVFPLIWWLCQELFSAPFYGWLSVSILAVAPFQVLYARQARPIGFWIVTILLSSLLLLRALRVQKTSAWILYAISLAIGFYTYLFGVFVAVAHGIYVFAIERRLSKTLVAFGLALGGSLLVFLPWIVIILLHLDQVQSTTSGSTAEIRPALADLYRIWTHHLTVAFIDPAAFDQPGSLPKLFYKAVPALFYWAVRLLVLAAFYLLYRRTAIRTWLFVVTLTLIPALALLLPDLILGGSRASVPRYFAPMYLGFELAVIYLLASQLIRTVKWNDWRRSFWRIATVTIVASGIASCVIIAQAEAWWTQTVGHHNPEFAHIINRSAQPLVVSDAVLGDLLSLSHSLKPDVQVLARPECFSCTVNHELIDQPFLPEIPPGFSDVFLYHPRPSEQYLQQLNQQHGNQLEVISQGFDAWFWKIKSGNT